MLMKVSKQIYKVNSNKLLRLDRLLVNAQLDYINNNTYCNAQLVLC